MIGARASASLETESAQLRAAVDALDPIVALLSLVHLTGDRSLLTSLGQAFDGTQRGPQSTFAGPLGTVKKTADPVVVAEIRERLVQALSTNPTPILARPGKALFRQMAELCLGVHLDEAACDMAREQAGFTVDEVLEQLQQRYDGQLEAMVPALERFVAELVEDGLVAARPANDDGQAGAWPLPAGERQPFAAPVLQKYDDMQDLIMLDPIHEVDDSGWPARKADPRTA